MKVSLFGIYDMHHRTHTGVINFIKQYKIYTRENNFLSQSLGFFFTFFFTANSVLFNQKRMLFSSLVEPSEKEQSMLKVNKSEQYFKKHSRHCILSSRNELDGNKKQFLFYSCPHLKCRHQVRGCVRYRAP